MAANFYYQYQPLDDSEQHIRLLKIHHGAGPRWKGWKRRGPLFSLVHAPLDDLPEFEAVSYAWGSDARWEKLPMANGDAMSITKSVFEALPFLVDESQTGFLWIDQICIDQYNDAEKGHQVGLMSQVYRSATRTLIWLGPEDRETRATVELLEYLEAWDSSQTETTLHRLGDALEHPQGRDVMAKFGMRNRAAAASMIEKLISRSWFTRGWVVQELTLSYRPIFVIGRYNLSWQTIDASVKNIPWSDVRDINNLMRYSRLKGTKSFVKDLLRGTKSKITRASWFCPQLLANTKSFLTKDEKDCIFAYMGIWLPPGFEVNYQQNVCEAYIGFTHYLIEETGLLDIIGAGRGLRTPTSKSLHGLPSWVPDFSGSTVHPSLLWFQHPMELVGWNASKTKSHQKSNHIPESEVYALGKRVEIINFVITMSRITPNSLLDLYDKLQSTVTGFLSKSAFLEVIYDAYVCGQRARYFSLEDLQGCFEASEGQDRLMDEQDSTYISWSHSKEQNMENFLRVVPREFSTWNFVKTTTGKFCLSPPLTEPGDVIVILHGCCVPHVLRKTEDPARFRVVGDCYVYGAMRGEAVTWAEDEADLFILV